MTRTSHGYWAFAISLLITGSAYAAAQQKPSERALVMLDKKCTQMVDPYKLDENFVKLIFGSATTFLDGVSKKVLGKSVTGGGDIPDGMRLQAKRTNWLPMRTEVLFGERAHAQETNLLERDSKIGKKLYPTADALLDDISKNIGEQHDYKFQLFILKNSTRNAVARPGGFLYLDQGLLDDAKQTPKARFALAHEIAHVLQRHETRELQGLVVDSFETKKDLRDAMTKSKTDPSAVLDKVKVNKDSYARHHIDQELQADSCAARMLSRAYPNGDQLAVALNAFILDLAPPDASTPAAAPASTSKEGSKAEQLAATAHEIVATPAHRHPNTQERVQNLKEIYAELTTTAASTS